MIRRLVTVTGSAGLVGSGSRYRGLVDFGLRYAMVGVLVVLAIVADILSPGFFELQNLQNILTQNAPVGLVAAGMTFVIICGGFDLSVAAILAVGSVLFASFSGSMPIPIAAVATVGVGLLAGAFNGFIVTRLKVNAFVATLGTASIFSGLAFIFSNSEPVFQERSGFDFLGSGEILGIPVSIYILVGVFLIAGLVLARTTYGRSVYSIGGNTEAARLCGLRVDLIRASTYLLTGALAALGGMLIASQTGVGQAEIASSVTLDSIAIVIIGGTSLIGGEGAMWRTAVGLLILATINNVFDALALDVAPQSVVKGAIIVIAVSLDSYTRRRVG